MSEVVTGPLPLPGEGQDITEMSQRMSIRGFVDYFQDYLPQPFRVDTASNQRYGELREGDQYKPGNCIPVIQIKNALSKLKDTHTHIHTY